MIESIKQAKLLKEQGVTTKDIEDKVGIARAYIPKLLELYEQMSDLQQVDDKNSDYVRIKKKRYLMKSIKLQHRMADIRDIYIEQLKVLKNKRKKISEYMDQAGDINDIKEELKNKQTMLNVTSSNLQHAEDGYEYLKQEVRWNYLIYFMSGIIFLGSLMVAAKYGGFIKVLL